MRASFANSEPGAAPALDVRARILVSLTVSTAVLFMDSPAALGAMAAATFLYALTTRRHKALGVSYLFILAMYATSYLVMGGCYWLAEIAARMCLGPDAKLVQTLATYKTTLFTNLSIPFLRMLPMLNVTLAIAVNFQVQHFMAAMRAVRLPRFVFLPLAVFCRFIPEFTANAGQLRDAVRMRGNGAGLRHTLIPMFVRTLRMGDNLAMAAEMKRVGCTRRPTLLNTPVLHARDILAVAAVVAATALALAVQFLHTTGGAR